MSSVSHALRVVVVDDDNQFRATLARNLMHEGYAVTSLSSSGALEYFDAGGTADAVLLDWRMPGSNELEVLRSLRRAGSATPVVFLSVLGQQVHGAVEDDVADFIEGLHRLSNPIKRRRSASSDLPASHAQCSRADNVLQIGRLELRFDVYRASWAGMSINVTMTEFKILALLARRTGEDVSYREIYDLVHGKNFAAGIGHEACRPNVRTFIKRIRRKLHAVDPEGEHIQNYAGFGYRYHPTAAAPTIR